MSDVKGDRMDAIRLGVWVWGSLTAVLGALAFIILIIATFYIDPPVGWRAGKPKWLPPVYKVLQDNGSLIGTIIGFSAIAWSYFFQAMTKQK